MPGAEVAAGWAFKQFLSWVWEQCSSLLKSRSHLLVLGCSGVGKSQFLASLTGKSGCPISRHARTTRYHVVDIEIKGSLFRFIDSPGQYKRELDDAIREAVYSHAVAIVNVVANGYHETNDAAFSVDMVIDGSIVRPEYLEERRKQEIAQITRDLIHFQSIRRPQDPFPALLTVVNKADLWNESAHSALNHYASGDYNKALLAAHPDLRCFVAEYSGARKPFYAKIAGDPMYGDENAHESRERIRDNLVNLGKQS